MKDERDSISNQSDQSLINIKPISNRIEPQQMSSISLPTDTDTLPSTSSSSSTSNKRQFEKIKNELVDETSSANEITQINPSVLTSSSSNLNELNEIPIESSSKHLIESESKRQKSETNISSVIITNDDDSSSSSSSSSGAASTLMEIDSSSNVETNESTSDLTDSKQTNSTSPSFNITNQSKLTTSEVNDESQPSETTSESTTATVSNETKQVKSNKIKIDLTECHDWDRIHDTVYFKEKSLNLNDIINREFGYAGRFGHGNRNNFGFNVMSKQKNKYNERTVCNLQLQSSRQLIAKGMSSFNYVRRMKMTQNLNYHEGCVNALNFNRIGTLLASGSDDYQVCIWDWARSKVLLTFDSGHKSNVFQTKFMPFTRDSQIVTCARDGQVRLALISSSGSHIGTKKLAKHSDSCHKLSIEYDSSNMFLSCGEDAVVYEIDLRQQTPAKVLTVKNYNRNCKLPLYSVSNNPIDTYQFAVAGKDPYIRIYDKRMLVDDRSKILKLFAPNHLKESQRVSITSAVYNHNGTEIIGSYSDEDIYLFETEQDSETDAKFRYRGHRNSETIKGVNFYGANSDFIVSGSDCGRVFFWEKYTQQIVQALKGDENGVVNVLEPHPNFPILATSGLDSDIKIWSPTSEEPNKLDNLADIIKDNQRVRETNRHFSLSSFEFELILLLMHRPNDRVFIRSNEEEFLRSRLAERETNASTNSEQNPSTNSNHLRARRLLLNRIEAENENESEATTASNEDDEDEDDDDDYNDEDEDNDEEDDDDYDGFQHYDDDDDNESGYNYHDNDNENANESSDNSRLASFFARRRYSRERNTDSRTSDQSSSNQNSANNRNT